MEFQNQTKKIQLRLGLWFIISSKIYPNAKHFLFAMLVNSSAIDYPLIYYFHFSICVSDKDRDALQIFKLLSFWAMKSESKRTGL